MGGGLLTDLYPPPWGVDTDPCASPTGWVGVNESLKNLPTQFLIPTSDDENGKNYKGYNKLRSRLI